MFVWKLEIFFLLVDKLYLRGNVLRARAISMNIAKNLVTRQIQANTGRARVSSGGKKLQEGQ